MSCLPSNYNPVPTRVWNRFTRRCDIVSTILQNVDPASVNLAQASVLDSYKKGNILQYKGNSGKLTKKQLYAQIAKGNTTNVWGTQTDAATQPNTKSFQRINYSYINLNNNIINGNDIIETKNALCIPVVPAPIYAPLPSLPASPSDYVPPIIPPPPTQGSGSGIVIPVSTNVIPPTIQFVLPNGGNLVCSRIVNPCTNDVIEEFVSNVKCFPTTDSDVPGPNVTLCWNSGLSTYFPRQRKTYGNSNNKFPTNSKAIVPIL